VGTVVLVCSENTYDHRCHHHVAFDTTYDLVMVNVSCTVPFSDSTKLTQHEYIRLVGTQQKRSCEHERTPR